MTSNELHRWARPLFVAGFVERFMREPNTPEVQAIQAVGWLETRYGTAWKGAGIGSNNFGAIQSGHPPCPVATSFQNKDSHPEPDGSSTFYTICFRKYVTPSLGASDLVRVGYLRRPSVLAAATAGNFYGVSAALRTTGYYEGMGATVAQRIANHFKALSGSARAIALALGEPYADASVPVTEPWQDDFLPDNPMILRGSRGPYVRVWQQILNERAGVEPLAADGAFGALTASSTKLWQKAHGLQADAVVGPLTWAAAA